MSIAAIFFYVFGALAVFGALGMVLNLRNTVAGAMCLVLAMVALAGVYVVLGAHLVAVFQIMVYGGAIVVLFLFVVMLLNVRTDEFAPGRQRALKLGGTVVSLVALAALLRLLTGFPEFPSAPEGFGGYRAVGIALYTDYVLLVEIASLLMLAAIVGALILAKRKID